MALSAGTRLGLYEIVNPLGAGGMGEVYRARDTKLNRDVAIKILPAEFALDPDRLARFKREAQVLASLNHPNIAAIYGSEESDGVQALVLELVEGDTLADRIACGAISVEDALPLANQIADALEAAHEAGIVHRDLKPANIKVRPDGTVKVLDFGLAKLAEPTGSSTGANASLSPTITTPAMMTGVGVMLGTAAYMSPEQAKGRPADKRSDIWAFGCVLFEMLTAKRAFDGEDATDVIAAVVRGEPDWHALPRAVPPHIRDIVKRCLVKDRKARLPDVSVVRFLMNAEPVRADVSPDRAMLPAPVAAAIAVAVAVVAVVGTWSLVRPAPSPPPQPARFTLPPSTTFSIDTFGMFRDLVLSPDGRRLVYTSGTSRTASELVVRAIDQLDPVPIRGLQSPVSPFGSPDSKWIGFFDSGQLKKVSMTGGAPITLCSLAGAARGGAWGSNDTIVFATSLTDSGLQSVSAGGGEPMVLTKPDPKKNEAAHVFPSMLPGNRAVLFTIVTNGPIENAQVAALDLQTRKVKTLIRGGSHAEYVESSAPVAGRNGYLVYAASGSLRAVRFDPVRLEILSDAVTVLDSVRTKPSGAAEFTVSRAGDLVYLPGFASVGTGDPRSLVWVDRSGHEEPIPAAPNRSYVIPRLSPDGTRVALDIRDQENDIWVLDLTHGTLTRLTIDRAPDGYPVWTPDGRRIIFASARNGAPNVYWQPADNTGVAERLTTSTDNQNPYSVSPDGKTLVFGDLSSITRFDLMRLNLDPPEPDLPGAPGPSRPVAAGARAVRTLVQTPAMEANAEISPDGRWIAYQSDASGPMQIFVRPFPNVDDGHWQVSTGGGTRPVWSRNGRELFYLDAKNLLTAVSVQLSSTFNFGTAKTLLNAAYWAGINGRTYDVSADGKKFLMIKDVDAANRTSPSQSTMIMVLNWIEELKERVPAK